MSRRSPAEQLLRVVFIHVREPRYNRTVKDGLCRHNIEFRFRIHHLLFERVNGEIK